MSQDNIYASILTAFLLPPGPSILLLMLALVFRTPKLHRLFLILGLTTLYLSSIPITSNWLRIQLETDPPVALEHIAAEAIVVLGADRRRGALEYGGSDTLNRLGLERLRYAAWLSKKTGLPILVSGGSVQGDRTPEAEMMRDVLKEFGVEARWLEGKSRNTYENAQFSAQLLKGVGIGEVLLVTHAWHMPRAAEAFWKAGMRVVPAPTGISEQDASPEASDWLPNASSLQMSYWALHEMLGRLWYRIHYYGLSA